MAFATPLSTTCFWCAPTPSAVVRTLPLVSAGGAGFTPVVPWHDVQLRFATSIAPFMCSPPATLIVPSALTVPGWQELQAVLWACGAGGGKPWQLPHCACVPSTLVHTGVMAAPPFTAPDPPWQ